MMRQLLLPFSIVYGTVVCLRKRLFEKGIRKTYCLSTPTLCVGNLTVGGVGKTPLVIEIVSRLINQGHRPAIISRGYRRTDESKTIVVVADGNRRRVGTREGGDEPCALAERLTGVPIIVGANRKAAGDKAITEFSPDVVVMDDGFQHFGLKRDVDIVVFDVTRNVNDLRLLPAGRLREPMKAINRAQALVLTKVNRVSGKNVEDWIRDVRRFDKTIPIIKARQELSGMFPLEIGGDDEKGELGRGKRVLLVSGIGNPEGFAQSVRAETSLQVVGEARYRNHHWYRKEDINKIEEKRVATGAEWVVTTEKDAVKIREVGGNLSRWYVARVAMSFDPEDSDKLDAILRSAFSGTRRAAAEHEQA